MSYMQETIDELHYRPTGRSYQIRTAVTLRDLDEVHRVTHDSIVAAGYMKRRPSGRLISYPALDASPMTTILLAVDNGAVVGTHSIVMDSELGLPTDETFPLETGAIRLEKRRLVSFFRLATDPARETHRTSALLLDLLRCAFVVSIYRYSFDTMLCGFNPKHAAAYERLAGGRMLTPARRLNNGDIDAGAVLMRVDRERLHSRFANDIVATAEKLLPRSEIDEFAAMLPTARHFRSDRSARNS